MGSVDRVRSRLYSSYVSTHAGRSDGSSDFLAFRRDIRPHLPPDNGGTALDIGCGQGRLVQQLINHGWQGASGIDVSPEQVEIAHELGITSVQCGDYRQALSSDKLDVVVATDLLEHLTKQEVLELFDLVCGALRPGGVFIARCPNGTSPFFGNYQYSDFTHETALAPRSFCQLAKAAGFDHVGCYDCPPIVHGVASAARAAAWRVGAGAIRIMLTAETGARGHLVAQNFVGVAGVR